MTKRDAAAVSNAAHKPTITEQISGLLPVGIRPDALVSGRGGQIEAIQLETIGQVGDVIANIKVAPDGTATTTYACADQDKKGRCEAFFRSLCPGKNGQCTSSPQHLDRSMVAKVFALIRGK